jgi:acyl-CoA synthetase (NDP forming)
VKLQKKKELPKIEDFLKLKSFALVGASATKKKFGNYILKAMVERGFRVYPVHRTADSVSGVKCYNSFDELPEVPQAVIVVVPPKQSEIVVKQAAEAGVKNVWLLPCQ